ncbi:DUF3365 domain-containing protein [Scytonema hofmannii FACHB-248]|uniref:DUF3365 domain-containing protein n=1 Tax=Scytonema hofmannii FACHB-248 TaxID=1842502 RepID=A0ABR8GK76_9CYAN|nr:MULTISPECIES: DUF3365 domain-containing protein [Nostocales]MBD2603792.1 DUF3365 domain-containing protein [Scytonema hofmannii FACHB-248]
MLRRLKLASQFTLLLSLIFIAGIALGGLALSKALEQKAEMEMSHRGEMAMQMVNAVKSYTSKDIAPLIAQIADPQTQFIPETIPSLAARQVFDTLKQTWKYKDFIYKDATLNPTNLADQVDRFEAKLIERFESDRTLKTLSGFRTQAGERLFYSAQPLAVTNSSCLVCHSTPQLAPKSHVEKYGTQNGFGWKLNQIIGTQIIYIPASEVFRNARQALFLFISIFMGIFALVIVFINYLLKWRVIQPLKPMAQLAQTIILDHLSVTEVRKLEREGLTQIAQRTDELGQLGRVFQKMVREVCDREAHRRHREQQLSEQLQQLQVEIDSSKVITQVAEIAESDYFQKLQKTAKEIRNQWSH